MWLFVSAGVLYLLGIAIVLLLKPTLMFTPDGQWKEFGIGQDESKYSSFPFWLFCFVWAIASYTLVVVVFSLLNKLTEQKVDGDKNFTETLKKGLTNVYASNKNVKSRNVLHEFNDTEVDFTDGTDKLPNGYYVLNKKATRLSGMPKYVYLGNQEPSS
jgi:hypothetical protein